jgi:hypothetical protein
MCARARPLFPAALCGLLRPCRARIDVDRAKVWRRSWARQAMLAAAVALVSGAAGAAPPDRPVNFAVRLGLPYAIGPAGHGTRQCPPQQSATPIAVPAISGCVTAYTFRPWGYRYHRARLWTRAARDSDCTGLPDYDVVPCYCPGVNNLIDPRQRLTVLSTVIASFAGGNL